MSEEIDKEVTTRKVTPLSNNSVNGNRISEERTTRVSHDDSNASAFIAVVLLTLLAGAGAVIYYINTRPSPIQSPPTQIVVPKTTDTVKENKSTIIERNNTTIKEVSPAAPQPTPTVEINVPVTITPPPAAPAPEPRATVTVQPTVAPVVTPKASVQPQTPPPNTGN